MRHPRFFIRIPWWLLILAAPFLLFGYALYGILLFGLLIGKAIAAIGRDVSHRHALKVAAAPKALPASIPTRPDLP